MNIKYEGKFLSFFLDDRGHHDDKKIQFKNRYVLMDFKKIKIFPQIFPQNKKAYRKSL